MGGEIPVKPVCGFILMSLCCEYVLIISVMCRSYDKMLSRSSTC